MADDYKRIIQAIGAIGPIDANGLAAASGAIAGCAIVGGVDGQQIALQLINAGIAQLGRSSASPDHLVEAWNETIVAAMPTLRLAMERFGSQAVGNA